MFANSSNRNSNIASGLAAGLAGGLVASWVMSRFQTFWSEAASALQEKPQEQANSTDSGQKSSDSKGEQQDEPATVKAAEALASKVFQHELTDAQKKLGGPVMHYAMGVTTGAVYGMLCEIEPSASAGDGLLFGASVWGMADNVVVPSLGLSKWPAAYPASTHVYALASHLVYGVTVELVRRIVRRVL